MVNKHVKINVAERSIASVIGAQQRLTLPAAPIERTIPDDIDGRSFQIFGQVQDQS